MRIFKYFLAALGLLFLALVGWIVYQFVAPSPPITVSPQTTVITEPLADDGLPDYAKYLLDEMREGVTPENNGAIPFLKATWPAGMDAEEAAAVCREVGMQIPAGKGMQSPASDGQLIAKIRDRNAIGLQIPEQNNANSELDDRETPWESEFDRELTPEEQVEELAYDLLYWADEQSWTRDDVPLLFEWLEQHDLHFHLLYQVAEMPAFYYPSPTLLLNPRVSLVTIYQPGPQVVRDAINCLAVRANLRIGEDDLHVAWHDTKVMFRLAEFAYDGSYIGIIVRARCNEIAYRTTGYILQSSSLDEVTARQILEFLQQKSTYEEVTTAILGHEWYSLVTSLIEFSGVREGSQPQASFIHERSDDSHDVLTIDWNVVLSSFNEQYEHYAKAYTILDEDERQAALAKFATGFQIASRGIARDRATLLLSRNERSKAVAFEYLETMLSFPSIVRDSEIRDNAQLQLHHTAAALAVYCLEHGDYPESLEALVPKQLKQVPVDLFHANPLVYQKTETGYLLYSLGPNGQDDGGSNSMLDIYRGYEATRDDERRNAALLELLMGELPAENADTEVEDEEVWLEDLIPQDADDHAIRLPLPRVPMPKLEAVE